MYIYIQLLLYIDAPFIPLSLCVLIALFYLLFVLLVIYYARQSPMDNSKVNFSQFVCETVCLCNTFVNKWYSRK